MKRLKLLVEWPKGRDVPVEILILPDLAEGAGKAAPEELAKEGVPLEELGPQDLESLSALHTFLARLTRSAEPGEVVEASCARFHAEALLDLLEVEGMPSTPIPVVLPSDG